FDAALVQVEVLHQQGCLRPVMGHQREDERERLAIAGIAAAMHDGEHDDLVLQHPIYHGVGHRSAEEVHQDGAVTPHAVVGFNAALRLVAGIDHGDLDRMAVDPAHLVDEGQVIALALVVTAGDEGIDRSEVLQQSELDRLFLRLHRRGADQNSQGRRHGRFLKRSLHSLLLLMLSFWLESKLSFWRAGTARPGSISASCHRSWPSPTARTAGSRRSGRRTPSAGYGPAGWWRQTASQGRPSRPLHWSARWAPAARRQRPGRRPARCPARPQAPWPRSGWRR